MSKSMKVMLLLLSTLMAAGMVANAQTERGTIRGTVEDSTGAVVAGVKVTARNTATGVQLSTETAEGGNYNIPNLPPGTYQVEAERTGFKKLVSKDVKVDVAEIKSLDLRLEPGEITERVTVEAGDIQIQRENSELSTSVNPRSYIDLPVSASGSRSAEAFIFLAPGTSGDTFNAHVNGSQTLSREIQIDGLSTAISEVPGDPRVVTLPPDAVQEFSIATSGYSSEFGNTGGGISRLTVKSGTNEIHGNLYEFLRNDKLDARGFFNETRSINRQNEFGGSVGGPIFLPRFGEGGPAFYDGRNKSFFFVNVNRFRFRSGPQNALVSVPTAAFKNGDFSALRDNQGNLIQIYDPATTRPDGQGGFTRNPFPNNIIPANRISSVSRAVAALIPDPTQPGIVNNFAAVGKNFSDNDNYTFKLDHNFNANHRISGTYNDGQNIDSGPVAALPHPLSNTRAGNNTQKTLRLSYDWVINPTLINHLAAGFNRQTQLLEALEQGQNWGRQLGLNGIPNGAFPNINFSPFIPLGLNQELILPISNTFLLADSLSWVRNKHNLKFGIDFRKLQNNFRFPSTSGNYNFSRNETAFPSSALRDSTGNAFASFLLGQVDSAGFRLSDVTTGGRWTQFATYVQDDYKVSPRLTLNLGLRWDLFMPLREVNDIYSIMDPTVPNPRAGGRLGAVVFAGEGPFPRTGRHRLTDGISYNNFGPRVGLAYSLNKGTVIRGAYGISYFPTGALGGGNIRALPGGFESSPSFFSQDLGLTPAFSWDSGFPQNYDRPPFIDAGFQVGGNITMWNDNAEEPMYRQDWNLGVQRQLGAWLFEVSYVGAKGTRMNTGVYNVNQVDSKYLRLGDLLTKRIDDPAVVAAGFIPPYAGFTGTLAQALRPFPQYNSVGVANSANVGNMTYHSLQAKVEKQFSKGLFLLSSYTWSKTLTDSSSVLGGFISTSARDHYNRRLEKALSVFDVPHRLAVGFNYELPFGPGKPVANVKGAVGKIVGGWQINGILNYQSGEPIGVSVNNTLPLFNGLNLPNVMPGISPTLSRDNFDPATDLYLDINAFRAPAPFTIGNASAVLPNARNFPYFNENFGILKRTSITEGVNLELRFEMFNAFNRVRFGGPSSNVSDPFGFGKVSSQANQPRQGQFAMKINF